MRAVRPLLWQLAQHKSSDLPADATPRRQNSVERINKNNLCFTAFTPPMVRWKLSRCKHNHADANQCNLVLECHYWVECFDLTAALISKGRKDVSRGSSQQVQQGHMMRLTSHSKLIQLNHETSTGAIQMWNSWKALCIFGLFSPLIPLSYCCCNSWPACLAAEENCQLQSASDLLLCQHLFCGRHRPTAGAAASGRRRAGSGVNVRKTLFEVVSGAWRCTGVILTGRQSQPAGSAVRRSREPNGASGGDELDCWYWKVILGTLRSDSRWVTQQRRWPCQFCQRACVFTCKRLWCSYSQIEEENPTFQEI